MNAATPLFRFPNLLPLLLFALLLSLGGCRPEGQPVTGLDSGPDSNQQGPKIAELETKLEELGRNYADLLKENESLLEQLKEMDALKAAAEELEETRNALEALKKEFAGYKDEYKVSIRKKAVGTEIGSLATTDGKTYDQVSIKGFSDDTMMIAHASGMATLPFADLPEAVRRLYGFEPPQAEIDDALLAAPPGEAVVALEDPDTSPLPPKAGGKKSYAAQAEDTEKELEQKRNELVEAEAQRKASDERVIELKQAITDLNNQFDQHTRTLASQLGAIDDQMRTLAAGAGSGSVRMSKADLDKKLRPLEAGKTKAQQALASSEAAYRQKTSELEIAYRKERQNNTEVYARSNQLRSNVRTLERNLQWLNDRAASQN